MRNFYTITTDEFETAARFLQVVALMEAYSGRNYTLYHHLSDRTSGGRDKLCEWLESHVPNCIDWTSDPARGTTVQWDGTVLSLRNREGVLAKFHLPMLLEKPRRHDRYAHIHGADVTNNAPHNAFEGRTDLRELVVVGTLGRVLSLLDKDDYLDSDIANARESVRRTIQDAGIYVEPSASDPAFEDSLIVWGYYGAPIEAIERGAASEKKRQKRGIIELFKPSSVVEVGVAVVVAPDTWRKAKPEKTEPEKTEPEKTEPESKRRNLWGWALIAFELLAIVWICHIYATQGPYSPELAATCAVAALTSTVGIAALRSTDDQDE